MCVVVLYQLLGHIKLGGQGRIGLVLIQVANHDVAPEGGKLIDPRPGVMQQVAGGGGGMGGRGGDHVRGKVCRGWIGDGVHVQASKDIAKVIAEDEVQPRLPPRAGPIELPPSVQ